MASIVSLDAEREARGGEAPEGFADLPPIMSAPRLGEAIEIDPKTLERWRKSWPNGACTGPRWSQAPGTKLYRYYRRDVLAWLDEGLINEEKPGAATPGQNINN